MAVIGRLVRGETIPDNRVLQEGERGPYLRFPLPMTPPVFTRMVAGGNTRLLKIGKVDAAEFEFAPFIRPGKLLRYSATAPIAPSTIQVAALVHARALGGPKVLTQARPASLVHNRGLGDHIVIPPPVTPPEPPPTPTPTPEVRTPRNLRYVRKRNRPERN